MKRQKRRKRKRRRRTKKESDFLVKLKLRSFGFIDDIVPEDRKREIDFHIVPVQIILK